jgi:hypothetical protein
MYNNNSLDQNKFFYQDFKYLQKVAMISFNILINNSENPFKNKKYIQLKILVQRITIWKQRPIFSICLDNNSFYRLRRKTIKNEQ